MEQHALPGPGPHGNRKLRESCISCSSSKVKCNKEKPTCARCVRRGLSCEYRVSRRTGRTRVIGVEKPPTTTKAGPSTSTPSIAALSTDNNNAIATTGAPPVPNTPPVTTTQPSPTPDSLQSPPTDEQREFWSSILASDPANFTEISSLNTDIDHLFAALPDAGAMDTGGMVDLPESDPPFTQSNGQSAGTGSASAPQPHHFCLAVCLETMMRLFPNASAGCEQSGGQEGPRKLCTIESVIEDNKQTIDRIQTVLECRCAQDEYVTTLSSLIIFKIMSWYVAVARGRSSASAAAADGWDVGIHSQAAPFAEQVLHMPTVVGAYCIDGHNQSRMAAQLVLSELHRVRRLVSLLARRLEALRRRPVSPASLADSSSSSSSLLDSGDSSLLLSGVGASLLSSTTLTHLEEDMRKRLRAVSTETIDILRRA
ncbi:Transcription factor [Aspergillus sp. HF37]|nr:Transcription factor [Aspergillus sp. HF37]